MDMVTRDLLILQKVRRCLPKTVAICLRVIEVIDPNVNRYIEFLDFRHLHPEKGWYTLVLDDVLNLA